MQQMSWAGVLEITHNGHAGRSGKKGNMQVHYRGWFCLQRVCSDCIERSSSIGSSLLLKLRPGGKKVEARQLERGAI